MGFRGRQVSTDDISLEIPTIVPELIVVLAD